MNLDSHYNTTPYCFTLQAMRNINMESSAPLNCIYCENGTIFTSRAEMLRHTTSCVSYLEFKIQEKEVQLRFSEIETNRLLQEQRNKYESLLEKKENELNALRNEYHSRTIELMNRIEQMLVSTAYGNSTATSMSSKHFAGGVSGTNDIHSNKNIPLPHQLRLNELNLEPLDMEHVKNTIANYTYDDLYIKGPTHYIPNCLRKNGKYMVRKPTSKNIFVYYDLTKTNFVNDNMMVNLLSDIRVLIDKQLDAEQENYFKSLCAKNIYCIINETTKNSHLSMEEARERNKEQYLKFREFLQTKKASLWKDILKIVKPYFS